ncbi:MAG: 3(2),5-bisphosphate nucleotidase [Bacteroidetes bacterium]|nr:3(2),5-bisphosphate nucleotidase [Bacteroidota bacterium]
MNYNELLYAAIQASVKAGKCIERIYQNPFEVEYKSDSTPVTIADKEANAIIEKELEAFGVPVLGEEGEHFIYDKRKNWDHIWIVDPLDGTKEFINRNGEFTVNIALSENNQTVIGVIFSPVFKDLYFAANGLGSFKLDKHVYIENINRFTSLSLEEIIRLSVKLPLQALPKAHTIVASRSHPNIETKKFVQERKQEQGDVQSIYTGSSIKMCLIAEGKAHEYPRYGRTMEWDTCAGHCILKNAGGEIISLEDNLPLRYNKENIENPNFLAFRKS